ncbi:MAG: divalent-cation tolerance protein CutA [Pseudomonadota bacterium]|nr:divalent-cation tolerance protein CutA [Pseudomonadota bacterium]
MKHAHLLVLCNCPDGDTAETIAETVVALGLAACVTITPDVKSVYRWQGRVETESEYSLTIKTTTTAYQELERTLFEAHPYDVPEIIAIPIVAGLPEYLAWIDESTTSR